MDNTRGERMQAERQMSNIAQEESEKKLKALANDILAKCQEQELSYAEMRTLIIMLSGRLESAQTALRDLPISVVGITPF